VLERPLEGRIDAAWANKASQVLVVLTHDEADRLLQLMFRGSAQ
jgi:hypothetical protein